MQISYSVSKWSLSHLMIIVIFIMTSVSVRAQGSYYYIQFADRPHNSYSLSHPEKYLSPKAIARRQLQNIPVTEDDMPLDINYVSTVSSIAPHITHCLKWDNAIIVKSEDETIISKLLKLVFVKDVKKISSDGPSTMHKLSDFPASRLKTDGIDTGFYGVAANQNTMIAIHRLHEKGYWGDGVLIAVMDDGFKGVDINPYFTTTFATSKVLYTWNYVHGDSMVYTNDTHGAETFSCIASYIPHQMVGTAPGASFLLFVTEDASSEKIIEEYNWAAAAEKADSLGAEIFSTSLGYTTFDKADSMDNHTYAQLDGHSTPIARAANKAASKGIIVVNSAGNDGANSWHYIGTPGDADSAVSVGAVGRDGSIAYFSGWGPNSSGRVKPDICAQGNLAAVVSPEGSLTNSGGTSFSCPISAGAFACLRQAFPQVPNMVLIDAVQRTGNYYSHPDPHYGYGIPDFGMAYSYLQNLYPTDSSTDLSHTSLYPIPYRSSFKINTTDINTDMMQIEMYDLAGRKVYETNVTRHYYFNAITITPPANLPAGIYITHINQKFTYKVVKED